MDVSVGTFNLNNLFSRFNFESQVDAIIEDDPAEPVFSRDLLEVDILHPTTRTRLFTVFNNHLKSQFVRRTRHGGDGSDHDPAWVTLRL